MIKAQSLLTLSKLLCILLISSLSGLVLAKPIILSEHETKPVELGPHYQLLVDHNDSLTIDDILKPTNQVLFAKLNNPSANLGFRKQTHWFKVDVSNKSPLPLKQLLEFNFPLLDHIGIYVTNTASKRIIARYDAGDSRAFTQRLVNNANFIFPLTLPAHSDLSLYFKIKSTGSLSANAHLWQAELFPEQNQRHYILFLLYAGLLIGLMAYHSQLFLLFKQSSYIYFNLFAASLLLSIGASNGIWYQYLWPMKPEWHQLSLPVGLALSGLFANLLTKSIFNTANNDPSLNRMLNFLAVPFILILILMPFVSTLYTLPILYVLISLFVLMTILASVLLAISGQRAAITYLLGWLVLMATGIVLIANYLNYLSQPTWLFEFIIIAAMIQAVVHAAALAQQLITLSLSHQEKQQNAALSDSQMFYALKESERQLLNRLKDHSDSLAEAEQTVQAQQEALKQQATHDLITGLPNQTLIKEQIKVLLTRCTREKQKLAILVFEIENLAEVTEEYSPQICDHLLINMTKTLHEKLRHGDLLGRLNENEFILVVESENDRLEHEKVANRIRKSFSHRLFVDGYSIQAIVNIGSALFPDNGESLETLVSVANKSMGTNTNSKDS